MQAVLQDVILLQVTVNPGTCRRLEKGSEHWLHEGSAVPTVSFLTARHKHNLRLCRTVHLNSQTSSEVYSRVLQFQVSSRMVGQRRKLLWAVGYETE